MYGLIKMATTYAEQQRKSDAGLEGMGTGFMVGAPIGAVGAGLYSELKEHPENVARAKRNGQFVFDSEKGIGEWHDRVFGRDTDRLDQQQRQLDFAQSRIENRLHQVHQDISRAHPSMLPKLHQAKQQLEAEWNDINASHQNLMQKRMEMVEEFAANDAKRTEEALYKSNEALGKGMAFAKKQRWLTPLLGALGGGALGASIYGSYKENQA